MALCWVFKYRTLLLHIELRKAMARHLLQNDALSALMNGPIRAKLGSTIPANVTWGGKPITIYNVVAVNMSQLIPYSAKLWRIYLHRDFWKVKLW